MLKLYVGNKNYSSWSMRAGVLVAQAGIECEEVVVPFDAFTEGSQFKRTMAALSPTALVPLLVDGDLQIWDSLAICEYLAERFPELQLWPQDPGARALARSVCAEMHGGFGALRNHCPMNIEADLSTQGAIIWRDQAQVRADVERIVAMWSGLLDRHAASHADGLLFGRFCIADAYFAPVVMRLTGYGLPVPPVIQAYLARVRGLPGVRSWIDAALAEKQFVAFDEPYRVSR